MWVWTWGTGRRDTACRLYDRQVEELADKKYPETKLLRQARGVGALTALAFILRPGDKRRFAKSRDVGAYLGLVPRKEQSGTIDPQLPISSPEGTEEFPVASSQSSVLLS